MPIKRLEGRVKILLVLTKEEAESLALLIELSHGNGGYMSRETRAILDRLNARDELGAWPDEDGEMKVKS